MNGWQCWLPRAEGKWLAGIELTDGNGAPLEGEITRGEGGTVYLDAWAVKALAIPCRTDVEVVWDGQVPVLRFGPDAYELKPHEG